MLPTSLAQGMDRQKRTAANEGGLSQRPFFGGVVWELAACPVWGRRMRASAANRFTGWLQPMKWAPQNAEKTPISLMDALLILVLYHGQYLFQIQQQQHVHVQHAIGDQRRRRNLTHSVKLITSFVGLRSLLR